MEGTSVHRLTGAIDKNVHSGGHIWRFLSGGGGTPHNGLHEEAPSERDIFFRLQV